MAKNKAEKSTLTDVEREAISIVRGEKQRWEDAVAFVTEQIAFKMRDLIRVCRKNFYGIFDYPYDESTGREKLWYPLTEMFVNAAVKNFDLDTKDVGFRAKNPNGYAITDLTRSIVKDALEKINFGEVLDMTERMLAIDGTTVWKTFEREKKLVRSDVDLLNIYIDPTSPSIQEAYRFTERSLQFPMDLARMSGWKDTKNITPVTGLPRTDPTYNQGNMNSNVKMVDVYETWGKVPSWIVPGEAAYENPQHPEAQKEVDAQIVVSGIDSPGKERCHLIRKNDHLDYEGNALKPYEEAWYERVPGRWYGKGISEKLMPFQLYANEILNIRRNRNYVTQLGLFKVRKGSGITPQQLRRLPSNGAVVVSSMDDLEQFVMNDVPSSSYNDEKVVSDVAQKVTSAFDVVTGSALPSSTPATNASIQNTNAKSMFVMIREGLGMFLKRWMDRHALPIIVEDTSIGDMIRIDGGDDKLRAVFERVVSWYAIEELEKRAKEGVVPSEEEMLKAIAMSEDKLRKRNDIFVEVLKKIEAQHIDTEIYFTNEEMDVGITTQRLMSMLQLAPEFKGPIVKQLFDLMGLPMPSLPQGQPQQGAPGAGTPQPSPMNAMQATMPAITMGNQVPGMNPQTA